MPVAESMHRPGEEAFTPSEIPGGKDWNEEVYPRNLHKTRTSQLGEFRTPRKGKGLNGLYLSRLSTADLKGEVWRGVKYLLEQVRSREGGFLDKNPSPQNSK